MRLVLIGDIHFFTRRVQPWRLLNKRLLGLASLLFSRQFRFDRALLEPVLRRAGQLQPDLILFTGDLTTTSLEAEFQAVQQVIRQHLNGSPVLVVPGNHDRYTASAARARLLERFLGALVPESFPYFRKLAGRWHLLVLEAAQPTWLSARGMIGAAQLEQTRRILEKLTADDGLIIACHYPATLPGHVRDPRGHRLADRQALLRVLGLCPARQIYVHGHVHEPWVWRPPERRNWRLISINAGSPTLRSALYPAGQGFWELVLEEDPRRPVRAWRHVPRGVPPLRWDRWDRLAKNSVEPESWQVEPVL